MPYHVQQQLEAARRLAFFVDGLGAGVLVHAVPIVPHPGLPKAPRRSV